MVRLEHFVLLFAVLALCSATRTSYDGFQVIRVPTGEDSQAVDGIISQFNLDTWRYTWSFADIIIPPHHIAAFTEKMQEAGLNTTILDQDVGASIAAEGPIAATKNPLPGHEDVWLEEWFEDYHDIDDHWTWMDTLAKQYPLNVKLIDFGKSTDGAPIRAVHIHGNATYSDIRNRNTTIVFHGTVHAREWITTMVVEYAALELARQADVPSKMRDFDYYIFPIVNPDGFLYSQKHDRMWRKNREVNNGSTCLGVDLNRHWPYMWDIDGGASKTPCSEAFRGFSPATSKETQGLINGFEWINQTHGSISLYIDWHSYSQVILSPYGYDCKKQPENHKAMQKLMEGAMAALKKPYDTKFKAGPICESMYLASGTSVDYAYDVMRARNAFAVELRPSSFHRGGGFLLPRDQINPSAVEAWEAIKYLVENMQDR